MNKKVSIACIVTLVTLVTTLSTTISTNLYRGTVSSLTLSNIIALAVPPEPGLTKYDHYESLSLNCNVGTQIYIEVSTDPDYEEGRHHDYSSSLAEKLVKKGITFTVKPGGNYGIKVECGPGIEDCTPYSCGIW